MLHIFYMFGGTLEMCRSLFSRAWGAREAPKLSLILLPLHLCEFQTLRNNEIWLKIPTVYLDGWGISAVKLLSHELDLSHIVDLCSTLREQQQGYFFLLLSALFFLNALKALLLPSLPRCDVPARWKSMLFPTGFFSSLKEPASLLLSSVTHRAGPEHAHLPAHVSYCVMFPNWDSVLLLYEYCCAAGHRYSQNHLWMVHHLSILGCSLHSSSVLRLIELLQGKRAAPAERETLLYGVIKCKLKDKIKCFVLAH